MIDRRFSSSLEHKESVVGILAKHPLTVSSESDSEIPQKEEGSYPDLNTPIFALRAQKDVLPHMENKRESSFSDHLKTPEQAIGAQPERKDSLYKTRLSSSPVVHKRDETCSPLASESERKGQESRDTSPTLIPNFKLASFEENFALLGPSSPAPKDDHPTVSIPEESLLQKDLIFESPTIIDKAKTNLDVGRIKDFRQEDSPIPFSKDDFNPQPSQELLM
mmetsp:Transcript_37046/g.56802  ORF Transcript_37046/g.56802 Transcript_37046/m.56802 type:complete len:221 (+) Transcript_37046:2507-3169(+)|eukprot:CAMPEP_0170489102 /NCGR_PEP_ID=MMETSP0208-20121228/7504_1 /TAXON_ID=197538 /ORGANISM="Strombidium inclinatum, Strain S3" /LENGTH=220 /DNA_ID=CAMNT_0010763879 /DNA_START=2988 /DNA_END=3650 /DNA_ORIENTATION=+